MHDEALRALLIAAEQEDRAVRARLAASGALFEGYHPEMEVVHLKNAQLLEQAFDHIGWPGPDHVGEDGMRAAFLILQHAISRPDLQRRGLRLVEEAIPLGQATRLEAAMLSDRIAFFEGRPQTYGTQFDWDERGELSPWTIAEPEDVDARRAEAGLPPLAEKLAEIRRDSAGEKPPDPARIAESDEWARRVGWRAYRDPR